MLGEFLLKLAASIFGAILLLIFQYLYRELRELSGPYSGTWEDKIYNKNGEVVKVDRFEIRQRGEVLKGTVARTSPQDQIHRKYAFEGRIRGSVFFAIYWCTDRAIPRNGCWYMRQTGDDRFEGYYLKLDEGDANKIVPTRISLFRLQALERPSWVPERLLRWLRDRS